MRALTTRWPLAAALLFAASCSSSDATSPGPGVLTSILLVAPSGTVAVGGTVQMRADVKDQNGKPINATVTWTSSANVVATVSPTGLVTGVAPGSTVITAKSGSVSSTSLTFTVLSGDGTYPLTAEVFMPGNTFSPFIADIARTGTVTFIFPPDPHNVIWVQGVPGTPADIDILSNTTRTRQFNVAGTFTYNCLVHPGMTGIIVVH